MMNLLGRSRVAKRLSNPLGVASVGPPIRPNRFSVFPLQEPMHAAVPPFRVSDGQPPRARGVPVPPVLLAGREWSLPVRRGSHEW